MTTSLHKFNGLKMRFSKLHLVLLTIVAALFLTSNCATAQIVTFDFAGILGSETTANSNFNDVNLTGSVISRGTGLSNGGNADRFNGTNWALTSIANAVSGNKYMEITVTPLPGYQFSVSSITIQVQRSGTGPSAVALRNSVNGFATDLDGVKTITDNTSTQSFTFTFSQANSTAAVTYRFYMYAEATTGSGGIGDATGNDLVVNGTVTPVAVPTPMLGASVGSIAGLTYIQGAGPSDPATAFSVAGSNLTPASGSVWLLPSTNVEVYDGTNWQSDSFAVAYSAGSVTTDEIFETRLKAGLPAGTYNGESIIVRGGGAADTVDVSGSVTVANAPILTLSETAFTGLDYIQTAGPSSASTAFSVSGANLVPASGNITITPSANFEVFDGTTWHSTSFTTAYSAGAISSSAVYQVRLKAGLTANTYGPEIITVTGGGASASLTASGSVLASVLTASIGSISGLTYETGSGPSAGSGTISITGSNLTPESGSVTLTPSANIEIFNGTSWQATALTVAYSGAVLNTGALYQVRLKAGLAVGSYTSESLDIAGGGTTTSISVSGTVTAPVIDYMSLVTPGTPASENFNTLATSGSSSVLPNGWFLSESGSGANAFYAANAGAANSGDTYSYGTGTDADRALGGLQSGSVVPTIGTKIRNNSGSPVTALNVAYKGEEWRLGTAGRADRLDFQYSTNATSLTTGTWIDFNALDFNTPTITGTVGARDGNAAGFFSNVTAQITGLNLAANAEIWFRWSSFDASGADDGLAIDDVNVSIPAAAISSATTSVSNLTYVEGNGPSDSSTHFSVTGSYLLPSSSNITFTPSSNIEIFDGSIWHSSPFTVAYTNGTFSVSDYAVRLKAGLSAATYNTESVTVSGGSATAFVITVSGAVTPAGVPALGSSETSFTGLSYIATAGPSAPSGTFSITGTDLVPAAGNVTITPSASFEVFDGTTWSSTSVDVAYTGGVLSTSAIYQVRLKAGLTVGTYGPEAITIIGGGASANISASGSVLATTLTTSSTTFTGLTYVQGNGPSAASATFSITGANLTPASGNITLTPSANIELFDGTTWQATAITVAYTGNAITTTSLYQVRLKAGLTANTFAAESVTVSGGGGNASISVSGTVTAPVVDYVELTALGSSVVENFTGLALSGTANTVVPTGWFFSESGSSANTTYAADNGSSNAGNTYSYGATGSAERAFGGLQSGNTVPTIGAKILNNTGTAIATLSIAYRGEQWRLGATGRNDRLDFQYSLNATSLANGTWIDVNTLDFIAPLSTGTVGPLNGNTNISNINSQITGLNIPAGSTVWIRWSSFDATGSDDGLAIDDVYISGCSASPIATWTGLGTSSSWSDAGNWSACTGVPAAGANVVIPATSNQPVVSGPVSVGSLELQNGAIVDINFSTFTINGTLTGTGTFSGGVGAGLVINGSGAFGTLYFNQLTNGTTNNLGQLTINRTGGSVSLGNTLFIATKLTPTAGVLSTGGFLTLRSTATQTAAVGIGSTAGGYVSGDVTVERYLSGPEDGLLNRAWRMLSVPTFGSQTINDAWQEGQAAAVNGNPGYGTNISSSAATWQAAGFDFQTLSGSMQRYNPATNTYSYVGSTAAPIATTSGYFLYLRGDRSVLASPSAADNTSTTLRTKGSLYQGDRPAIDVGANKFAMVGNVYASAIDFEKMRQDAINTGTGLAGGLTSGNPNHTGTFYVWDPRLSNGTSLGGYQTFSSNSGYTAVPGGGSYAGNNSRIESGQAFFIYAAGTSGAITLKESYKEDGSYNVQRPSAVPPQFKTNLYRFRNGAPQLADGNIVVFDNAFSNSVDGDDALKLPNFDENIGLFRDNNILVIEARQSIVEDDTVYFRMWNMQPENYLLKFTTINWTAAGVSAFLEDSYLGTSTPLSMTAVNDINFTVNSTPASSAQTRFRVVFKQTAPVPVTFTSVTALPKQSGIQVDWKVAGERGIVQYIVERSADGRSFNGVGTVGANGSSNYGFFDANPIAGTSFYRIKTIDASGSIKYTNIVKVVLGNLTPSFTITPNPIENNLLNVLFSNQVKGRYTIRMVNNLGQTVYSRVAEHAGGSALQSFTLPGLVSGHYNVEIISPAKTTTVEKVLVNMTR